MRGSVADIPVSLLLGLATALIASWIASVFTDEHASMLLFAAIVSGLTLYEADRRQKDRIRSALALEIADVRRQDERNRETPTMTGAEAASVLGVVSPSRPNP